MEMQKLKLALLDKKQSENNQHERFARSNKDSCTEDQMKEKDSTIKSLQKEVFRLNDELKNTKVPILPQVNDQEIKLLQQRIKQLEKVIHDNQVNNNNANNNNNNDIDNINNNNGESTDAGRLKQEKEAAVSQIDFLNAVIVDLQRKNTDLENKVQLLESSKSMTDSALEKFLASDANLTNIRPFCDICDMFDQHDTEDCPKQNGGGGVGSSGTSPMNASHYHGDPNEERPYCTTCEVFGHNLDQCKEEQTY
ncbi:hypothetical protein HELRODRAFT_111063 [Helobdella robusta]|uniref:CLIP1 zinc knuckle domain-containing protein n=1 Tax=Helobdella robusta TaxID=6412 RepID=T1EF75_HELRO|nr:hypothetical protein HELRODRAFT_111063 [Helobdella robusta]ESO05493.1 hypothetical protein HELRODRAFT_111063 [Helobdella robusta]